MERLHWHTKRFPNMTTRILLTLFLAGACASAAVTNISSNIRTVVADTNGIVKWPTTLGLSNSLGGNVLLLGGTNGTAKAIGIETNNVFVIKSSSGEHLMQIDDNGNVNVPFGAVTVGETTTTGAVKAYGGIIDSENVKYYGALGDGTTDDTAAIIAAATNSSIVYIPPGTYKVSSTFQITKSNTKFYGAKGTYIDVANNTGVYIYTATNIVMDGITFTGTNQYGLTFGGCKDIVVSNCKFVNMVTNPAAGTAWAFGLSTVTNAIIENCIFNSSCDTNQSNAYGIYASACDRLNITDNTCLFSNIHYSVAIFYSKYCSVANNYVDQGSIGNTNNSGYGVLLYSTTLRGVGNIVRGNYICNSSGDAIYTVCQDQVLIANNICTNVAIDKTGYSLPSSGISVHQSDGAIVTGNIVHRSAHAGIEISTVTNATVVGNQIRDVAVRGIYLRGNNHNTTIVGNEITTTAQGIANNNPTGLQIFDSLNISENVVIGSTNLGIYITGATRSRFSENVISGTPGTDNGNIQIVGGTNNLISGNNSFNSTVGVYTTSTNSVISGNVVHGVSSISVRSDGTGCYVVNNIVLDGSPAVVAGTDKPYTTASPSFAWHEFYGPRTTNTVKSVARFMNPNDTGADGAGSRLMVGNSHAGIVGKRQSSTNSLLVLEASNSGSGLVEVMSLNGGNSNAIFQGSLQALGGFVSSDSTAGLTATNVVGADGTNWTIVVKSGLITSFSHDP